MPKFGQLLRNFREDEGGNAAIEMLLCVPIMVWALLSTLVYFDAYHDEAISTRAGLTIADMFSREDTAVNDEYMQGALKALVSLTGVKDDTTTANTYEGTALRVTVYQYVDKDKKFGVVWSENIGYGSDHDDTTLASLKPGLPMMADGATSIFVETKTKYSAPFSVTISPFIVPDLDGVEFNSFTVISPRFQGSICWKETSSSDEICSLQDLP